MSVKNITVDHDNEGRRIDNFLFSNFKNIPKSKIYKVIRKGEVRVNSKRVKPDTKLSKNDGWTVTTKDRRLSAQWEHTLAVTSAGCEILTLRSDEDL